MKVMIGRDSVDQGMLYLLTDDGKERREFSSKKIAVEFLIDWDKDLNNKTIKETYHFVPFKAKEPQPA